MWLGVNAPQRIDRLVLANTAAKIGTADMWNARIDAIRNGGMAAVASAVLARWFTPAMLEQPTPTGRQASRDASSARPAERLRRVLRGGARHGPARQRCRASTRRRW